MLYGNGKRSSQDAKLGVLLRLKRCGGKPAASLRPRDRAVGGEGAEGTVCSGMLCA